MVYTFKHKTNEHNFNIFIIVLWNGLAKNLPTKQKYALFVC